LSVFRGHLIRQMKVNLRGISCFKVVVSAPAWLHGGAYLLARERGTHFNLKESMSYKGSKLLARGSGGRSSPDLSSRLGTYRIM
jgi:hypothetical protein